MDLVIRRLNPSTEGTTIYKPLRLRALSTDPQQFGSTFERESSFPDEKFILRSERMHVAFVSGNPAGVVGHFYEERQRDKKMVAWLVSFWVAPEYRKRGIGTALVKKIVEIVVEKNGDELVLEVHKENMQAKRLYEREGFVVMGPAEEEGEIEMTYQGSSSSK
ncbi:acyl-CoA N-acyltransferase [Atractiella rhizophila]|nr:acyl-CoA N-acyltransferase [Atractiella rhizophila]